MQLAVLSDTHGHVPFTQDALRLLAEFEVAGVVHCGDIGSVEVVRLLAPWAPHYVFGNVDRDEDDLRQGIANFGGTCHDRFGTIEAAGRRIAFLHGDDGARLRETIASGAYDLVCSGHTHRRHEEQVGHTLSLNPGALYRADPRSFALVELDSLNVDFIEP